MTRTQNHAAVVAGAVLSWTLGAPPSSLARPTDYAVQAISSVRSHRTNGYLTVAQTLAQAERARPDSFRLARIWAERRHDEPFTRVHLCYWLRPPEVRAQPTCGIDYLVTTNPTHVELATPLDGLGRDFQAGPEQFIRVIDHALAVQTQPAVTALRDAVERFNPYDWR